MQGSNEDLIALFVFDAIGVIAPSEIRARVVELLTEQSDDQMYEIANCGNADDICIRKAVAELYSARGFNKATWLSIVKGYAVLISRQILSDDIGAGEGANLISRATTLRRWDPEFHDLDTFICADSELPAECPERHDYFLSKIREEAAEWASYDPAAFILSIEASDSAP